METIFAFAVILITGYYLGLLAERHKLPRVTAYLLAGILFSNEILGNYIQLNLNGWSEIFSNICLAFIAYIIGSEIDYTKLLKSKSLLIWTTLGESLTPTILVFIAFSILGIWIPMPSFLPAVMASIACTTAPAATIAIIEQFKSKGETTDLLMEVVALDDALGIIIFSLVISFLFGGSIQSSIGAFIYEIFFSITLGAILGFIINRSARLSIGDDFLLPLLVGLIFLITYLSHTFHLSILLTSMAFGFVANNLSRKKNNFSLLLPIQHIEELIFIIFFTLAGIHFSLDHFINSLGFILLYVVVRAIGKYLGAFVGSTIGGGNDPLLSRYIGLTLMPQAGVAIGLILQLTHYPQVSEYKGLILNIILGSTIIYEIVGPFLTKYALVKTHNILS